jgi:hypothetical protein
VARAVNAARLPFAPFVAAALLLLGAAFARADVDVELRFGHGGGWVADAATPVEVVLRNRASAPVSVSMVVTQSGFAESDTFVLERTVALGPQAARAEVFLVPGPTGYSPELEVEVTTSPSVPVHSNERTGDRGRLSVKLTDAMRVAQGARPEREAIVGVLLDPRNVVASTVARRAVKLVGDEDDKGSQVAALPVDADLLRLAPLALDGIETLVVCDPDGAFCADPAVLEALLDWVALGGRLVVSLGENAGGFGASPLAASLPAHRAPSVRGEYADIARDLGARNLDAQLRTGPVVPLTPDAALGGSGEGLRVEARYGSGTIVVLGFDVRTMLGAVSFDDDAVSAVMRTVFGDPLVHPWKSEALRMTGTIDVADAVGTVLRQEAFRPPPVAAVLLGLFVYVLVVGPLDWFVLRRMRKERLTTFTFAGAVVVFTVVAYGVSIFLFASAAVVNRITFVQLASGGRSGRELMRVHDLAGFYAPTSDTRRLEYAFPSTVLGGSLPGLRQSGGVGAALPVVVRGNDPLGPKAEVEVAFRSQRVVRTSIAGATGRTIELTLAPDLRTLAVLNTLPVRLLDCWVFLPDGRVAVIGNVNPGATAVHRSTSRASSLGFPTSEAGFSSRFGGSSMEFTNDDAVRKFLAMLVTAPITSKSEPDGWLALRAAGIVRDAPREGRALIVGVADATPFELPGSSEPGRRHVVLFKETALP